MGLAGALRPRCERIEGGEDDIEGNYHRVPSVFYEYRHPDGSGAKQALRDGLGKRMQPCESGKPGSGPACSPMPPRMRRKYGILVPRNAVPGGAGVPSASMLAWTICPFSST